MNVTILSCPECGDEWHVLNVTDPRETCRECGAALEIDERGASG